MHIDSKRDCSNRPAAAFTAHSAVATHIAGPPANLKEQLTSCARQIGFDSCRVAACSPPPHADAFSDWLRLGAAGEMGYMERGEEKRRDPQKVLPGARSVIVLALNYWQGDVERRKEGKRPTLNAERPTPNSERGEATGRIARYAWGEDYHDVIAAKLKAMDEFLQGFGGTQKCYVDTGPILERDYAAEAGVGWHGKSTMLIDPKLGTWFFLAEILSTLQVTPDEPQADRCGTCERCIDACPTGAITSPHRLDARRCISYLTIELKSAIPLELRPLIGNRIFGCDDCLDACPWNRFAQAGHESAFAARPATTGMSLRDYLNLTDEEFRVLFRESPIKRIKRRGFLRNVCVALGNVGNASDLSALERAARDPEPLIAEHATWAINQIQERAGEGQISESERPAQPVPSMSLWTGFRLQRSS